MTNKALIASVEQIESQIFLIRGQKVMLDADFGRAWRVLHFSALPSYAKESKP